MTDRTQLDRAVESAAFPLYLIDTAGTITYVNGALTRETRYSGEELIGSPVDMILSGLTVAELLDRLNQPEPTTRRLYLIERHRDGTLHGATHYITPFAPGKNGVTGYLAVRPETTSQLTGGDDPQVQYLLHTDPLTNVHLRRTVSDEVDRELSRTQRHGHPLSVLLVDVDNMKGINDDYGHETGDAVLRNVATALTGCLRPSDRIGRWGDDEFLVLLPETDHTGAVRAAERIHAAVENASVLNDRIVTVTVGISAVAPANPKRPSGLTHSRESLVRLAEEELLQAKESGPGGISG